MTKERRSVGDEVFKDLETHMQEGALRSIAPAASSFAPTTRAAQSLLQGAGPTIERLKEAVAKLRAERNAGLVMLALDPKRIRHSALVSRSLLSLQESDPDLLELKEALKRDGQRQPIGVREVVGDPNIEYELVFGHRRHAAALLLDREIEGGFKINALIDAAAEDEGVLWLHQNSENAARRDLSAYETGQSFRLALDRGYAKDAQTLAQMVGISNATMTRYLQIARLPQEIVEAFGDPRVIALRWIDVITRALKADRAAVLSAARELASSAERSSPEVVLRTLLSAEAKSRPRPKASRTETFKIGGRPAFSYGFDKGKVGGDGRVAKASQVKIRFGKMVSPAKAAEMAEAVKELLQEKLGAEYGSGGGR